MSGHSNFVLVRAGLLGGDCFDARAARPSLPAFFENIEMRLFSSALLISLSV
jgi:hypothetical protein